MKDTSKLIKGQACFDDQEPQDFLDCFIEEGRYWNGWAWVWVTAEQVASQGEKLLYNWKADQGFLSDDLPEDYGFKMNDNNDLIFTDQGGDQYTCNTFTDEDGVQYYDLQMGLCFMVAVSEPVKKVTEHLQTMIESMQAIMELYDNHETVVDMFNNDVSEYPFNGSFDEVIADVKLWKEEIERGNS